VAAAAGVGGGGLELPAARADSGREFPKRKIHLESSDAMRNQPHLKTKKH